MKKYLLIPALFIAALATSYADCGGCEGHDKEKSCCKCGCESDGCDKEKCHTSKEKSCCAEKSKEAKKK